MSVFRVSALIFIASSLSLVINNLVGLGIVRILSPSEYGRVVYFLGTFAIVRFIATFRLDPYLIEEISKHQALEDYRTIAVITYSFGGFRLFAIIVIGLVLLAITVLSNDIVFLWAGIATICAACYDYILALAQGLQLYVQIILLFLSQAILNLSSIFLLFLSNNLSITMIYASLAVSFAIPMLISATIIHLKLRLQIEFSWHHIRQGLSVIASMFMVGIFNQLYLSQGALLLGLFNFVDEAAYFGTAFSLITLPINIAFAIAASTFYPSVVRSYTEGDLDSINRLTKNFMQSFFWLLLIPTIVVIVLADVVIMLLYTNTYTPAIDIFRIMSPLIIVLFLEQFGIFLLYACEKVKQAVCAMAVQATVSLALILFYRLFMPHDRIVTGVTIACLLGGIIGTILIWRFAHDIFRQPQKQFVSSELRL